MLHLCKQVAQSSCVLFSERVGAVSQRGRAMLHVIKYFAKTLMVTADHSK